VNSSSDMFDIAFIGHICFDEVIPYQGAPRVALGSAVLCGALAAARVEKKVAVVTKVAPEDESILEQMKQNGIDVRVIPSAQTTYMKVVHPTADVDERQFFHLANAGFFSLAEIPTLAARQVHLAGITDQEFDLDFIRGQIQRRLSIVCGYAEFRAPGASGNAPDFNRGRVQ
jgi:sugar/nucleoside kinase (ribokinase family)